MSVAEILDGCRAAIPGCQLVAFIDLDASMVLSVSAHAKQRQERLDSLGASASKFLPMPEDELAKCLEDDGKSAPPIAIVLSNAETIVFVRSTTEPREALCCCGSPSTRPDAMIETARSVLANISASE